MHANPFLLVICAAAGSVQLLPNAILAVVVFFYAVARYAHEMDHRPAILEMASLIAVIQLIVAPLLMYVAFNEHYRYRMYVPEDVYFALAIPAVCLFILGTEWKYRIGLAYPNMKFAHHNNSRPGLILVALGITASFASRYAPGQLGFLFYLLSQFRYVGAIYLYFSDYRYRWPVIAFACSALYVTASRYGMFHEILLWFSMATSYIFLQKPRSLQQKLGYLAVLFAAVSIIQLVKSQYRSEIQSGAQSSLFVTTVGVITSQEDAFGRDWQESMVIRLNQGWLVSKVMDTVPSKVAFANGETLFDAALASVLPRVLNPRKATASGRDNVNKYTGLALSRGTSMGLGPLGEGYANFGVAGALVVMFLFGSGLNLIYRFLCQASFKNSFFLFSIPVVFLQAIKMETEFLTIFNHLTKSSLVICGMYFLWVSRSPLFPTAGVRSLERLRPVSTDQLRRVAD
ncbi:hypothetical protein [Neorhodopirellula pilleata]|uniref:Uncharacterized protein n=1 Tax=Neorhodopirellula pilleata TaxID=2714738 RepID=A0A5C6AAF0_9BACT|nr:hypothetical protein [Neorhodopirellula pilleata]TWT96288.1 hypothetical protein Pla100_27650 [Neorhodopirellula pilleata]